MTNLTFKEELERSEKERRTGKKIKDDFCFWDYSFFIWMQIKYNVRFL